MKGGFIVMAALMLPLSLIAAPAQTADASAAQAPRTVSICAELLQHAQRVDCLLRSVSDMASADRIADELKALLDAMQRLCLQLENPPVSSAEDARELTASMRSLTHVFQGYIPVVERLMEVNAYGSEKLVSVFHLYKVREGYVTGSRREESPSVLYCQEWTEAMEDVLYMVRKLQTEADIRKVSVNLEHAVNRVEQCREKMGTVQDAALQDVWKTSRLYLESLCRELRDECTRLNAAGLLTEELSALLTRCHL